MHTGVQFNGVLSPCWQVKLTQILEYEISKCFHGLNYSFISISAENIKSGKEKKKDTYIP
jgi:hypothetical protein